MIRMRLGDIRIRLAAIMASVLVVASAGTSSSYLSAASTGKMVFDVTTDKSMYSPGATVELRIDMKNRTGLDIAGGKVEVRAKHLENEVGSALIKTYDLKNNADLMLTTDWKAPSTDYQGYLIEVDIKDAAGKILDSDAVGVDVSSTWVKFPRYGYVWDFGQNTNTAERIDKLKNYHINALQYYDWQYRHHKPLADNLDVWNDWSGRMIYGDTVRN